MDRQIHEMYGRSARQSLASTRLSALVLGGLLGASRWPADPAWAQPPHQGREDACAADEVRACPYCLPAPLSLDQGEGQQRCAQGTWDLSCQGAGPSRGQVELLGDDSRLRHDLGRSTPEHGWRVPAQGRVRGGRLVQAGPGQALPPGRYRVEFTGVVVAGGGRETGRGAETARLGFSVADATTGKVLAQAAAQAPPPGAFSQRLVFENPAGCHALELRVLHLGGAAVELRKTVVEAAGPAQAALSNGGGAAHAP
jgi:hypothetical protein